MINGNRQEITDVINGNDDRLLAIIGPCSDQLDDVIIDEGKRLANMTDNNVIFVHRSPPWKPRTNPERDWQGLDQSDPAHALSRKINLSSSGVPVAMEYGKTSHERFVPLLSLMWIGSRAIEDSSLLDSAIQNTPVPLGIKNGMDGAVRCAAEKVSYVNSVRKIIDRNAAPAFVIFRGGQDLINPDLWEKGYLRAHEITGGNFVVDSAHGGEMAHGSEGAFVKSVLGQLACLEHIRRLCDIGFAPKGLMVEASDVTITDKRRQTDPNIPFDEAIEYVNEISRIVANQKSMVS